jgi:hypothetical protein
MNGKPVGEGMIPEKIALEFTVSNAQKRLAEGNDVVEHIALHGRIRIPP